MPEISGFEGLKTPRQLRATRLLGRAARRKICLRIWSCPNIGIRVRIVAISRI
jgi:hypothetical protein